MLTSLHQLSPASLDSQLLLRIGATFGKSIPIARATSTVFCIIATFVLHQVRCSSRICNENKTIVIWNFKSLLHVKVRYLYVGPTLCLTQPSKYSLLGCSLHKHVCFTISHSFNRKFCDLCTEHSLQSLEHVLKFVNHVLVASPLFFLISI